MENIHYVPWVILLFNPLPGVMDLPVVPCEQRFPSKDAMHEKRISDWIIANCDKRRRRSSRYKKSDSKDSLK
jgi:hypothetical protein